MCHCVIWHHKNMHLQKSRHAGQIAMEESILSMIRALRFDVLGFKLSCRLAHLFASELLRQKVRPQKCSQEKGCDKSEASNRYRVWSAPCGTPLGASCSRCWGNVSSLLTPL